MHVSTESIVANKFLVNYNAGREQIIVLDADSIGKILQPGFLAFVATATATSAEIPFGALVQNKITPASVGTVVLGREYTVVTAGNGQDLSAVGGPASASTGDRFTATSDGVLGGNYVRGRIDYTALNPNLKLALVDLDDVFPVTSPNKVFAAGSESDFSLVGVEPSIVLVAPLLDNLSATTTPGVGDDADDRYSIGSRWINTVTGLVYTATNVTVGAAVWAVVNPVTPLDKLDATVAPGANNDVDEGYSVGSHWFDVTADDAYVCLDATDGAAVWKKTTP